MIFLALFIHLPAALNLFLSLVIIAGHIDLSVGSVAAAVGIVTGGIPALLLIGGWLNMHLHAAILVYGTQALWAILIGWLLLRGGHNLGCHAFYFYF